MRRLWRALGGPALADDEEIAENGVAEEVDAILSTDALVKDLPYRDTRTVIFVYGRPLITEPLPSPCPQFHPASPGGSPAAAVVSPAAADGGAAAGEGADVSQHQGGGEGKRVAAAGGGAAGGEVAAALQQQPQEAERSMQQELARQRERASGGVGRLEDAVRAAEGRLVKAVETMAGENSSGKQENVAAGSAAAAGASKREKAAKERAPAVDSASFSNSSSFTPAQEDEEEAQQQAQQQPRNARTAAEKTGGSVAAQQPQGQRERRRRPSRSSAAGGAATAERAGGGGSRGTGVAAGGGGGGACGWPPPLLLSTAGGGAGEAACVQPVVLTSLLYIRIVEACVGETHALFRCEAGNVYAYGQGPYGQLGLGRELLLARQPHVIGQRNDLPGNAGCSFGRAPVLKIACGEHHSLALTTAGAVYCWGAADCVGDGSGMSRYSPLQVPLLQHLPAGSNPLTACCKTIAARFQQSIAVTHGGHFFVWGETFFAQYFSRPRVLCLFPRAGPHSVVQVAIGKHFGLVLTENGQVYGWGDNTYGELTLAAASPAVPWTVPQLMHLKDSTGQSLPAAVAVAAGLRHAIVVTQDLRLWSFGDNLAGQCGVPGHQTRIGVPKLVRLGELRAKALKVACGYRHSACITPNHQLYLWGHSSYHKLIYTAAAEGMCEKVSQAGVAIRSGLKSSCCRARLIYSMLNLKIVAAALGSETTVIVTGDGDTQRRLQLRNPPGRSAVLAGPRLAGGPGAAGPRRRQTAAAGQADAASGTAGEDDSSAATSAAESRANDGETGEGENEKRSSASSSGSRLYTAAISRSRRKRGDGESGENEAQQKTLELV